MVSGAGKLLSEDQIQPAIYFCYYCFLYLVENNEKKKHTSLFGDVKL